MTVMDGFRFWLGKELLHIAGFFVFLALVILIAWLVGKR